MCRDSTNVKENVRPVQQLTSSPVVHYVDFPFNNFSLFHRNLQMDKLFRITYNLISGSMEERVVVMKKFVGIKQVAKPAHNSPLIVIKVVGDNFDRKIYFGKITKVEIKVEQEESIL